jgi:hypothetical protein
MQCLAEIAKYLATMADSDDSSFQEELGADI